jgi:hypothetical protein
MVRAVFEHRQAQGDGKPANIAGGQGVGRRSLGIDREAKFVRLSLERLGC